MQSALARNSEGEVMDYKVIDKKVTSSDGVHELAGKVYIPDGEIRGYFHIVHGMAEHIARYDAFMSTLAKEGYLTFGYDNLGHGHTAKDDSELGFIASRGGDDFLARDVKQFADAIISEYGEHPYYLLGHSMGSFIVRMAVQKYITPKKLIIMGTAGPNPMAGIGIFACKTVRLFKGERYYSPLLESLAFGSYNDKFKSENDAFSWLTKDKSVREIYAADKLCTFKFTVSALRDLVSLNRDCNKGAWFKDVAKKMPILLISGEDDPVGDYGKGIRAVEKKLKENGADVTAKLYPNNRHEILNDSARDEAISDILKFIAK